MKGRANYLCLHRLDQLTGSPSSSPATAPALGRCTKRASLPIDPRVVGPDRDRRSRRARGSARGSAVLERGLGDRRNLPRHRVPALRRLLRHAHAAARRRVRRRHRQPSSAVRRRGGAAERLRRGHPGLQSRDRRRSASARGRRDAVLRLQRQHLPRRGARARRRTAGRRRRRSTIATPATRSPRRSSGCAITRRDFFTELAFAHRGDGRLRGEERVRATDDVAGRHPRVGGRSERRARPPRIDAGAAEHAGRHRATPDERTTASTGGRSPRWRGAPASCATSCGSCCAPATPSTSTSSSSAAAASSCAPRRSTSRRSSASCCSIGCARRC